MGVVPVWLVSAVTFKYRYGLAEETGNDWALFETAKLNSPNLVKVVPSLLPSNLNDFMPVVIAVAAWRLVKDTVMIFLSVFISIKIQ